MNHENFLKVMVVNEGDVEVNGIFMKGFADDKVAALNLDKIAWVEEYNKLPHKHKKKLYMAIFEGQKRVIIYRELDDMQESDF